LITSIAFHCQGNGTDRILPGTLRQHRQFPLAAHPGF